jgi:hypothetical protein
LIHFAREPGRGGRFATPLFAVVSLIAACTTDMVIVGDGGNDAPVNRANGQKCEVDDECNSGVCAQGVCCSSKCDGVCMSCAVKTNVGFCGPVANGVLPDPGKTCRKDSPESCGLDGKCDGAGACRKYPDGSICSDGTCEGSTVVGAKACRGGVCQPGPNVVCTPFSCDAKTKKCFTSCAGNADCDGRSCVGNSCGKKPLGAECADAVDCDSGFCADGVCCNLACTGACVTCSQAGKMGECRPVAEGTRDEHGVCKVDLEQTCGQSGLCNGQGGCAKYGAGTVCQPASCSGGSMIPASTCNGLGTCLLGSAITCFPYVCADNACKGSCTSSSDCVSPNACAQPGPNGSCGKKGLGQKCNVPADCKSNFCKDGVCCDQRCDSTCAYCALPNAPGRCTTVPAGVTDPRGVCKNNGPGACNTNGKCNGARGCQSYPTGTVCRAGTCDSSTNRVTDDGTCRNGSCSSPSPTTCAPYRCNSNRCGSSCSTNSQCSSPNVCVDGSCGKRPVGQVCSKNSDCASAFCSQGVCCGTSCTASCFSCSLPGSIGTCAPVPSNGADPTGTCTDQGKGTCGNDGTCNGSGGCRKYPPATVCVAARCANGRYTSESTCDGMGKCGAGMSRDCAPFVCNPGGTACFDSCNASNQCMPPLMCQMGRCGLKDDGASCSDKAECKSNNCVDGFCCNSACTEVCRSCAVTGKLGTCSPIPDDVADDAGGCPMQAESSCGNDGKCNGAGACRKWGTSVQCRGASCPPAGATLTKAANCNGMGTCPPGETQSCGNYRCDTNDMCRTTCTGDGDCNGKVCDTSNGSCGDRRPGDPCNNNDECGSGNCVDKTCCLTASCGTCKSCANSDGTCKDVPNDMPDPDSCSDMGSCGTTGKCNGAGTCKVRAAGTECGQTCVGDEVVTKTCDGAGMCSGTGGTMSCQGFVCQNGACVTTCNPADNSGCVSPRICVNNTCEEPPANPDGGP